jgi:hypothetical protein
VWKAKSGIDLENYPEESKKKKAYKKLASACAQLKVDLSRLPGKKK